jgi:anaerobic ribonucleoside-triphosphate reductase activating protein
MLNGEGLRVVLWVAGCSHHCKECQNPCTWDPNGGIPFTQWEEAEFFEWLAKPWTQGATFSGGDPLHPANRNCIGKMMQFIKENYQGKDIWCYTGYRLEHSESEGFYLEDADGSRFQFPFLKYIDVLVDGRFECKVREADIAADRKVYWRGSSNQRIIDVQASLQNGKIITREI